MGIETRSIDDPSGRADLGDALPPLRVDRPNRKPGLPAKNDPLTALLETFRVRHARFSWIALSQPGSFIVPADFKFRFYCVLSGNARLEINQEPGPRQLNSGEVLLIANKENLRISTADGPQGQDVCDVVPDTFDPNIGWICVGGSGPTVVLMVGTLDVAPDDYRRFAARLPSVIQLETPDNSLPAWAEPLRQFGQMKSMLHGPGGPMVTARLGEAIFGQIVREHFKDSNFSDGVADAVIHAKIGLAVRLIEGDLTKDWTVSSLAGAVAMSRSSFAAAFGRVVGEGVAHSIARRRLKRASQLLNDGSLTVAEVAEKVGFSASSSFVRAFKREFNQSPSKYRLKHRPVQIPSPERLSRAYPHFLFTE